MRRADKHTPIVGEEEDSRGGELDSGKTRGWSWCMYHRVPIRRIHGRSLCCHASPSCCPARVSWRSSVPASESPSPHATPMLAERPAPSAKRQGARPAFPYLHLQPLRCSAPVRRRLPRIAAGPSNFATTELQIELCRCRSTGFDRSGSSSPRHHIA
jgi:hypothetical protein